jgi:hypothetical protein
LSSIRHNVIALAPRFVAGARGLEEKRNGILPCPSRRTREEERKSMSQRERNRRRLRELCQRDRSLLYACVPGEIGRRQLPPDILAVLTEAVCTGCQVPVVAHTPVLQGMEELARREGLHVLILCQSCSREACQGASRTELTFIDAGLVSRLQQWQTEAN